MELKILIADDEISIRQLIKKLIDPSAPDRGRSSGWKFSL